MTTFFFKLSIDSKSELVKSKIKKEEEKTHLFLSIILYNGHSIKIRKCIDNGQMLKAKRVIMPLTMYVVSAECYCGGVVV